MRAQIDFLATITAIQKKKNRPYEEILLWDLQSGYLQSPVQLRQLNPALEPIW